MVRPLGRRGVGREGGPLIPGDVVRDGAGRGRARRGDSDPAPEAFLYDAPRDVCGLIDWDLGLVAPRMYDVASAVMYLDP